MDREKVTKGLERCKLYNKENCDKCPYDYNGRGNGKSECTAELAEDALALLKEQEAVVRCKDCRYWLPMNSFHEDYHPGNGECELNRWVRQMDWFCADGERKEKEKSK